MTVKNTTQKPEGNTKLLAIKHYVANMTHNLTRSSAGVAYINNGRIVTGIVIILTLTQQKRFTRYSRRRHCNIRATPATSVVTNNDIGTE
mmetsp:Transcript_6880/g.14754  ORF Transcript_6880/g.14754 Transcript_6880/m.14754 type:complete len:90 (-) Transcript_6880:192-461(-)